MDSMIKLIKGYKKFQQHYFESNNLLFENLVEDGQKPKFLVIACCDSRVDPAIITGCAPGELFVVRNVANLVPPFDNDRKHHGTSAALEFAVCGLGVKHIIVLGHNHCGGIAALLKNETQAENPHRGFIESWMDIAVAARNNVQAKYSDLPFAEQACHCEKMALQISLNNLLTFPWIKEKVDAKMLYIHAWYFDLKKGEITRFDQQTKTFKKLEELLNEVEY